MDEVRGQLSHQDFQQAMRLFCCWWQQHHPHGPAWVLQSEVLPVVRQVVEFAQMDRIIVPDDWRPQQLPTQAQACSRSVLLQQPHQQQPTQQQQQQQQQQAALHDQAGCSSTPSASAGLDLGDTFADICSKIEADDDEAAWFDPRAVSTSSQSHQQQQQQQQHIHQYSIVYHETYRVPVLYLRGFTPDGRALSLSELMLGLPGMQSYMDPDQPAWTFITATEHPLTRGPCFMLHPCQTAARMGLLLEHASTRSSTPAAATQQQHHEAAGPAAAPAAVAKEAANTSSTAVQQATVHVAAEEAAKAQLGHPIPPSSSNAAAAAAAPATYACGPGNDLGGGDRAAPLLHYALGWFSMIGPLLGLNVLGHQM